MKNTIHDLLEISSSEQRGVMVLACMIILLALIRIFIAQHPARVETSEIVIDHFYDFNRPSTFITPVKPETTQKKNLSADKNDPFNFDPNIVSEADLKRLELNSRVISAWISYRKHGGRFKGKEEVKKIYGMSSQEYNRLEPYIFITDEGPSSLFPTKKIVESNAPISINQTGPEEIEKIVGIGPVLARRIISYRTLLGGFYSVKQVAEVYGLPDSLVKEMELKFFADTVSIKHLNINSAGEKELFRHPYIGRQLAPAILSYRNRVKRIVALDELIINGILTREQFKKLEKYLKI